MYEARKVANLILSTVDAEQNEITNLKLNKILYFVHGWGMSRLGYELIKNHFEAWKYGPVIRTVYDAFKENQNRPIRGLATYLNYSTGQVEVVGYADISDQHAKFILSVAGRYAKFSAGDLVDLTHKVGGPWWVIQAMEPPERGHSDRIPNDLISRHFLSLSGDKRVN